MIVQEVANERRRITMEAKIERTNYNIPVADLVLQVWSFKQQINNRILEAVVYADADIMVVFENGISIDDLSPDTVMADDQLCEFMYNIMTVWEIHRTESNLKANRQEIQVDEVMPSDKLVDRLIDELPKLDQPEG